MTGVEVTVGNCFPEVGEILPDADFPNGNMKAF